MYLKIKLYVLLCGCATLVLGGCANTHFSLRDTSHQQIRSASRTFALEVAPELGKYIQLWRSRNLVVGDFTNINTAENTVSGQELHSMLILDLRQELQGIKVLPMSQQNSLTDAISIQGTTRYVPGKADSPSWFKVQLTVTDLGAERKIGEASLLVNARQFDPMPSRFYRDAPLYLTGSRYKERLETIAGKGKNMRSVMSTDSAIADAVADYESNNYAASEKKFNAISQADSNNLTALSGYYQSLVKSGKPEQAEQAYGNLLRHAIAENNLSVKFLFRVRSKEFWDDGELGAQYSMWIRQIAREVLASGKCLEVSGHASKSGSAEYNETLSLVRAQWVMEQMIKVEPKLAKRLKATGKGFKENIIGSGSDDALDAIDRRVEFALTSCKHN